MTLPQQAQDMIHQHFEVLPQDCATDINLFENEKCVLIVGPPDSAQEMAEVFRNQTDLLLERLPAIGNMTAQLVTTTLYVNDTAEQTAQRQHILEYDPKSETAFRLTESLSRSFLPHQKRYSAIFFYAKEQVTSEFAYNLSIDLQRAAHMKFSN